ncbi:MAG: ATP-binding protein [Steroidobacteraceae bacterium]
MSFVGRVAGLALVVGLLAAIEVWHSYRQVTHAAQQSVDGLVRLLAEQTERTIQAVDLTLIGMRDALSVAPNIAANDASYRDTLRDRLKSLPYVRALFVIGSDGFIAHDTNFPTTPRINFADRAYFEAHRLHPDLGLHIGQPLRSRSTVGVWFVSLSRRISNADGSFGGIVVAAVEPRYFKRFYEGLQTGKDSVIALRLRDGTLLARTPDHDGSIGTSYAGSNVHSLTESAERGATWSTSPIDGIKRIIGYQTLGESPLVVLAGLAEHTVYQPWRKHAGIMAGVSVLVWLLASALMLLWERYRLRERLEQTRMAQGQRLELMGRLAGGIAHDLGNTLKVAQSTFALLKPTLSGHGEAIALVTEADRSLKSGFAIIDRLLAFARRQELSPRATNLQALISDFLPILKQAAGSGIQVELNSTSSPICQIDPVQLESALLNLVLNAREAMQNDDGHIVIDLYAGLAPGGLKNGHAVRSETSWAEIVVRDNGPGMSRDVMQHALEPFFTTKEGGNGLGLSQVLGFVQQSAGEIRLESKQALGTTVRLLFPAIS